ncbi:uncharacterized protein AKAW2_31629A [Aspergillus luchuensis]|uniref:Fumarylacetoacetase-like C-terminal domain-containing protein n=1 Tax=Aspergillus kawachii TaxID=1069201 RepID=A0A7R7W8F7_ASPKA|nr:uncharacterized protein AKAW2_31629A [Aspergillus luchuensis]BCR98310.1 hypothetical protein AKAW2_31629A [Aspergillus luchuensis]
MACIVECPDLPSSLHQIHGRPIWPFEITPFSVMLNLTSTTGELTVVIGKDAKNVSTENALDYCPGYTAGIDLARVNNTVKYL